jgi:hypothetical protein
MRTSVLLLVALLAFGCSSKNAHENDAEIITRIGVIMTRDEVEMRDVEAGARTNTSVYGGISSGAGFSIGLGVLLSPRTTGTSTREPMRYQVELQDGGQITVYHDSHDFQIGDCVEITVHPDEEEHPPRMKRIKDGC